MEVWGAASGARGSAAAVVCVLGVRPGVVELEVQRGSVLGNSKPLLVLPAGMEAMAAELRQLLPAGGGDGATAAACDALWRDLGAVVAWSEHHAQACQAAPHVTPVDSDSAFSCEDDSEEDGEEDGATPGQTALRQVPMLPAACVAGLASHAARYSRTRSWSTTAALLESAAAAAAAAMPAEDADEAEAAAAAPPPGVAESVVCLQRSEHCQAPSWRQQLQLQREEEPLLAAGPSRVLYGRQAGAALLAVAAIAAALAGLCW